MCVCVCVCVCVWHRALVRKFQGAHMQDIIATAFEAAGVPHVDPPSLRSQPPVARRNGEAVRRAALAGRLFRLCSPVALQLVHDMGVATTMNTSGADVRGWCACVCHGHALSCAVCAVCACADFFDTLRVMWALPAVSCCHPGATAFVSSLHH